MDGSNQTTSTALVQFSPNAVAEFGNKFIHAIVAHELVKEDAERTLAEAEKRESFIDWELTRAAMYLHEQEKVSVFDIFGDKADSEFLYRKILLELGVLKQNIDERTSKVSYDFVDAELAGQFYFDNDAKDALVKQHKKDGKDEETAKALMEAEIKRRRSRRNSLNLRLARACKASVALVDAKAGVDDLAYAKDETTGEQVPVIRKGPKEVMGKSKEPVRIYSKSAAKPEGATVNPTLGGLAKVAEGKHKAQPASVGETQGVDKKPGNGVVGEKDFLAQINVSMTMIKGREGKFADAETTVLKNLLTVLKESGIK